MIIMHSNIAKLLYVFMIELEMLSFWYLRGWAFIDYVDVQRFEAIKKHPQVLSIMMIVLKLNHQFALLYGNLFGHFRH